MLRTMTQKNRFLLFMLGYFTFLSYLNGCSKNSVEYNICRAILNNIDDLADMHVSDLAALSNTSEPSVKRYWKSLGFNSFQQMKYQLFTSYREFNLTHSTSTNLLFRSDGRIDPKPRLIGGAIIDAINMAISSYDFSQMDRFAERLLGDASGLLICASIQIPSILFLQAVLEMSGVPVSAPVLYSSKREQLENAAAKSAVLMCGMARHISELYYELLESVRANGAIVAVCVSDKNAPISTRADFNLSFDAINAAPSTYIFSFIMDYLALRCYELKTHKPK